MTFRSLFLGTAAVSLVATGAFAADLPDTMEPAEYVQVCDVHGSGFFRLPGLDTCLRVGGDVRAKYNFTSTGEATVEGKGGVKTAKEETKDADTAVDFNARGRVSVDARSQSDWGTVRAFTKVSGSTGGTAEIADAFVQIGNFTAGKSGSASNITLGSYAFNNNWGTYDADNSPWLVGYSFPVGYGVTISATVEQAVSTGYDVKRYEVGATPTLETGRPSYADGDDLSAPLIPDVSVGAKLAQGWGTVAVAGGLHSLEAEAKPIVDDPATDKDESEDSPDDLTGFGFFGGGGVEVNVLSTTKVGANGFYGIGSLQRIGANGGFEGFRLNDATVQTDGVSAKSGAAAPAATADDVLISAAGFTANGGITHSFSSDFAFHVNGGFLSINDGQDAEKVDSTSVTGFMAGGSIDYSPVSNVTFSVGGEFASFTKTTDYVNSDTDEVESRSDFAVTANISQSF